MADAPSRISPLACIHPEARLAPDVEVGPFTIIEANVEVGAGTRIGPHNVLKGPTRIGKNNQILQFCSIGEATPDLKYKGEPTWLIIGDNNIIREGVTIHRGTVQDRSETLIGDRNLLMAYVHIGHDSRIGNDTILVNNASLAGHVEVGDWAIISGYTGVHQYCQIGAHSFIGAYSWVTQDIPAYLMVAGNPAAPRTINREGLRRRGYTDAQIRILTLAYKKVFRSGLELATAIEELQSEFTDDPVLQVFIASLLGSRRGILR